MNKPKASTPRGWDADGGLGNPDGPESAFIEQSQEAPKEGPDKTPVPADNPCRAEDQKALV